MKEIRYVCERSDSIFIQIFINLNEPKELSITVILIPSIRWYNKKKQDVRTLMIKAVIFDMDGTILNTIDDIAASINHAFITLGYGEQSVHAVKMAVGSGAWTLIERLAPEHLSLEEKQILYQTYQDHYDKHNNIHTGPYEGIMELLDQLKQKGYKLAVVSNKHEYLVQELNVQIFHGVFEASIGEVPGVPIKPAPDNVYRALNILNVNKEESLFVGDSDVDIITAHNAGLKSVGVTWGFRDQQTLEAQHASYIIHKPEELLSILGRGTNI